MSYCSRSDIEDLFGTENVQTWANLDNGDVSDSDVLAAITARISRAITVAEAQIDKRFRRSRYAVPLVALAGESLDDLTDLAARLAGVWLYEARGTDERDEEGRPLHRLWMHKKHVDRAISRYLAGQDELPAVPRDQSGPVAPFVTG